jgi:hypothetical protein
LNAGSADDRSASVPGARCERRSTYDDRFEITAQENPMKGDATVIKHLQAQLKNELTAINQYFLHARIQRHWGLDRLAKKEHEESIGEMKHADRLMSVS